MRSKKKTLWLFNFPELTVVTDVCGNILTESKGCGVSRLCHALDDSKSLNFVVRAFERVRKDFFEFEDLPKNDGAIKRVNKNYLKHGIT